VRYPGGSMLDQWVAACFSLLMGVTALALAVRLLEAIWVALVVIGAIVAVIAGVVAWLRWDRQDYW
jgi:hypothetical protein